MLRRYAPRFLDVLKLRAAPTAKGVFDAIDVLRDMNSDNARKVPAGASTEFIRSRWAKLVRTDDGTDRRNYELCALSELKNTLRSGDVWVRGSRQFKDFDEYLVPVEKFTTLKLIKELPLAVTTDCDQYLRTAGIAGTAACHCQLHGCGQQSAGRHHYRVRLEDHAAGRGGAGDRASPDRPAGDAAAAARQHHRTLDGS